MNGFVMCDHQEVLDRGEYICINCGLILGQEYVTSINYGTSLNITNTNHGLYLNICDILEKLHLSVVCYGEQVYEVVNKYLSNYKCNSELKIGAGIFHALSLNDIPYQINKIARLVCLDTNEYKKFFKLIQVFPQKNTIQNDEFELINLVLSEYEKSDIENISKKIKQFKCEYCSYSPITQIAGISYLYFKNCKKEKISLKSMCDSLLISQNSVYLYLKHPCIKNWVLK